MRIVISLALAAALATLGIQFAAAQEGLATISVRVSYQDNPALVYHGGILIVPAGIRQPIPIEKARSLLIDANRESGSATSSVPAGDYLVGATHVNPDWAPSLTEQILVREGTTTVSYPARRIHVDDGETVAVEIRLLIPKTGVTPQPTATLPAGSISGHVMFIGPPQRERIWLVPSDTPQPIQWLGEFPTRSADIDSQGNFTFSGVPDGDYLLFPESSHLRPEVSISGNYPVASVTRILSGGRPVIGTAFRVTVAGGQAVTGVEITITVPTPQLPHGGLSGPSGLPTTGAEGSHDESIGYITVVVTASVVALLALAGGVALRLRRARRAG